MKAKVLKTYIDRETRIKYNRGEVVEVTEERFEEINSTSHGTILGAESDSNSQEKETDSNFNSDSSDVEKASQPETPNKKKNSK